MRLLLSGPFVSRAGLTLPFKVDCDALAWEDWEAIAAAVAPLLPTFGEAAGVPTGGVPLAAALHRYRQPRHGTVLACDDVWTTGGSWQRFAAEFAGREVIGLVLFARGPLPPNVRAVFHEADWLTKGRAAPCSTASS